MDIRFVFMNRDGEIVKQQSINRIIRRVVEAVVMNTKNYIYIVAGEQKSEWIIESCFPEYPVLNVLTLSTNN